jgi:hypothetical protein
MSTIKSSSDHLTINADGASKDIKFQANGVQKASISSAGAFTSTTIDATALTGNLPAISGASLTNLDASDLATGTVPTARLGSGTAGSGNFLRGDGAWEAAGGGKVLQVVTVNNAGTTGTSSTSWTAMGVYVDITPSATSSKILVLANFNSLITTGASNGQIQASIFADSTNLGSSGDGFMNDYFKSTLLGWESVSMATSYLHSPSTTSAVRYQLYMKNAISGNSCKIGWYNANTITLLEIGA